MLFIYAWALLTTTVIAVPYPQAPWPTAKSSFFPIHTANITSTAPSSSSPRPGTPNSNPCAVVSSLVAAQSAPATATVPAQLAYDCLNDVPVDAASAKPWLESLKPYLNWQSTLAYLKNPPSGYLQPAVDVWAEFAEIEAKVQNGGFANEYELEFALYRIFQSTHDGHFRYLPNMLGVFSFARPLALVSVSTNGVDLPKPYVYQDVLASFQNASAPPSPIATINGEAAVTYLENWSQYGSLQDPDALYNSVFYELAQISLGKSGLGAGTFSGGGRGAYIFPNATTILTFENGTTATYDNYARVMISFNGINSGAALYHHFVNPSGAKKRSNVATSTTSTVTTTTPRPGYPTPVDIQTNNFIGGYYLTAAGYEDVAVLSVASFEGKPDFQDVAYSFIEGAASDGKTKLVIDLSANGGGTILQGYNLFLNLFPDILPYGATRFRAHEAFDLIGEVASAAIPYYPFNISTAPAVWEDFAGGTPFDYRADVDINYQNFGSWPEKYGPHSLYGDNFTSIIRWNLSDPLNAPENGIQINGYGNRTGLPPSRPFDPDNIVILYDGYCASTCSIFSEFMTNQVGIKTIAIGGRPLENAAMQAVGGVKGTNNYPWDFIQELVYDVYALEPNQTSNFDTTVLYDYTHSNISDLPFERALAGSGSVNVRDGIRRGDESQTPLQFVYEAANCRLWYSMDMTVDVTVMWEKVVDVTWGGKACVHGSVRPSTLNKTDNGKHPQKRSTNLSATQLQELEESTKLRTDLNSISQNTHGKMLP